MSMFEKRFEKLKNVIKEKAKSWCWSCGLITIENGEDKDYCPRCGGMLHKDRVVKLSDILDLFEEDYKKYVSPFGSTSSGIQ